MGLSASLRGKGASAWQRESKTSAGEDEGEKVLVSRQEGTFDGGLDLPT